MRARVLCVKPLKALAVLLLAHIAALAAGGELATLRVKVLDPEGAVVSASQVQLRGEDGKVRDLSTGQTGEAMFLSITPGEYQVSVAAKGFAPREVEGLLLKPGVNQIEVRLEIAHVAEEVVVREDERERRTDPRGDAFTTLLTEDQLSDLPDDPEELEATLKRMAGPGAIIRVDGFTGGRLPPKSQIRQIRFRRNAYAAEYHELGFIGIDVMTKPGVSTWHSSLGFSFTDEALNTRNAFAPERSPEQLRQFELTLDAPLWRNRTSLFFAADGNRSYDAQTILAALPSGSFAGYVRRPSRSLYTSARLAHVLSKTHTLSVGFQRNSTRDDNLGVGGPDLPERAFSSGRVENLLRLSETGVVGERLFNELRVQARWRDNSLLPANDSPAIMVLGAFNAGGAQLSRDDQRREFEIADNLDFAFSQHAMRAGVSLEMGAYREDSALNTGGTFTFASLADFRAGTPATFTQRVGHQPIKFRQSQLGAYWQDDMRLRKNLTLSLGVRYERQNHLNDGNNFAPRLGLAWSPFKDGRTTLRGGAGLFYDWFAADAFGETLSADGRRQFDLVIIAPGFPDPFKGSAADVLRPSRLQRDPALRNPYFIQASLSVERQLTRQLYVNASYIYQRGVHLLRARDVNAPVPETGRPDPTAGNIVQIESSATSTRHSLDLTVNNVLSDRLYWLVGYSLSETIDDADNPFSLPSDSLDLRAERGPASNDMRHHAYATLGSRLFKGLRLGITFYADSALPYTVTTGHDDNGDTVFNDRPLGITRNGARGAPHWDVSTRLSWLFAFGESKGSGQASGPRLVRVSSSDVGALASELAASEKRWRINLYLQASNLLNHVNPINYVGVRTSPFFGQPTAALPGRRLEAGMRFSF
jgi:hypothetical protein